jgi:hypothetical protein
MLKISMQIFSFSFYLVHPPASAGVMLFRLSGGQQIRHVHQTFHILLTLDFPDGFKDIHDVLGHFFTSWFMFVIPDLIGFAAACKMESPGAGLITLKGGGHHRNSDQFYDAILNLGSR